MNSVNLHWDTYSQRPSRNSFLIILKTTAYSQNCHKADIPLTVLRVRIFFNF